MVVFVLIRASAWSWRQTKKWASPSARWFQADLILPTIQMALVQPKLPEVVTHGPRQGLFGVFSEGRLLQKVYLWAAVARMPSRSLPKEGAKQPTVVSGPIAGPAARMWARTQHFQSLTCTNCSGVVLTQTALGGFVLNPCTYAS
jgi:hypothetical protein